MRNTFAHEINPLGDKISQLIKKFNFYGEIKMPQDDNPIIQTGKDGLLVGMITGILMRQLVEILWDIDSKNKKQ